jgi:hypothetical protein
MAQGISFFSRALRTSSSKFSPPSANVHGVVCHLIKQYDEKSAGTDSTLLWQKSGAKRHGTPLFWAAGHRDCTCHCEAIHLHLTNQPSSFYFAKQATHKTAPSLQLLFATHLLNQASNTAREIALHTPNWPR